MKLHVEVVAFLFYFPHKPHKHLACPLREE